MVSTHHTALSADTTCRQVNNIFNLPLQRAHVFGIRNVPVDTGEMFSLR